jgi:hypothetical protein
MRALAATCGFLCFAVGGIVLLATVTQALQAKQAADWPTAQGRVVQSTVDVQEGKAVPFSAHVEYDFTVDGRSYHGQRIAMGPTKRDRQRADVEAVLARYPAGQAVAVHYNPTNPGDAVLEPRLELAGMNLGVSIFSGALAAGGVYLIYRGFRRPRASTVS